MKLISGFCMKFCLRSEKEDFIIEAYFRTRHLSAFKKAYGAFHMLANHFDIKYPLNIKYPIDFEITRDELKEEDDTNEFSFLITTDREGRPINQITFFGRVITSQDLEEKWRELTKEISVF